MSGGLFNFIRSVDKIGCFSIIVLFSVEVNFDHFMCRGGGGGADEIDESEMFKIMGL